MRQYGLSPRAQMARNLRQNRWAADTKALERDAQLQSDKATAGADKGGMWGGLLGAAGGMVAREALLYGLGAAATAATGGAGAALFLNPAVQKSLSLAIGLAPALMAQKGAEYGAEKMGEGAMGDLRQAKTFAGKRARPDVQAFLRDDLEAQAINWGTKAGKYAGLASGGLDFLSGQAAGTATKAAGEEFLGQAGNEVMKEKITDEVGARLLDLPASFRKPVEKYIASGDYTEAGLEQILKSHEDPAGSHFMSWLADLMKKDNTTGGIGGDEVRRHVAR